MSWGRDVGTGWPAATTVPASKHLGAVGCRAGQARCQAEHLVSLGKATLLWPVQQPAASPQRHSPLWAAALSGLCGPMYALGP